MEKWLDVPGYEGKYKVSDQGRFKSIINNIIMSPGKMPTGYLNISFQHKTFRAHRVVLMAFNPIKTKMDVNHKNNNKSDNRLVNLEWVTPKQNSEHAKKQGRILSGSNHKMAKINMSIANKIRSEYKKRPPKFVYGNASELSAKYKLSVDMIRRIVRGANWK